MGGGRFGFYSWRSPVGLFCLDHTSHELVYPCWVKDSRARAAPLAATARERPIAWTKGSLVRFAERGCLQANRVTLTKFCRGNNSFGDDHARHSRLTDVVA